MVGDIPVIFFIPEPDAEASTLSVLDIDDELRIPVAAGGELQQQLSHIVLHLGESELHYSASHLLCHLAGKLVSTTATRYLK